MPSVWPAWLEPAVESALFFPGVVQARRSKDHQGWVCPRRHWDPKALKPSNCVPARPSPKPLNISPFSYFSVPACIRSHIVSSRFSTVSRVPASSELLPMLIYLVFMNRVASFTPYFYKVSPQKVFSPGILSLQSIWQTPHPSQVSLSNPFAVKPSLVTLPFC